MKFSQSRALLSRSIFMRLDLVAFFRHGYLNIVVMPTRKVANFPPVDHIHVHFEY